MLPAHENCSVALATPRRPKETLRARVTRVSGVLRASAAIPQYASKFCLVLI